METSTTTNRISSFLLWAIGSGIVAGIVTIIFQRYVLSILVGEDISSFVGIYVLFLITMVLIVFFSTPVRHTIPTRRKWFAVILGSLVGGTVYILLGKLVDPLS